MLRLVYFAAINNNRNVRKAKNAVRVANAGDAGDIAEIQQRAMRETLVRALNAPLSARTLSRLSTEDFTRTWTAALRRPADQRELALIATENEKAVGFATVVPCEPADSPAARKHRPYSPPASKCEDDSDAVGRRAFEILNFEISSASFGRGHEARLLSAITDLIGPAAEESGSGETEIYLWIFESDTEKIRTFSAAGFAPCGLRRSFAIDGRQITQHLWWSVLS